MLRVELLGALCLSRGGRELDGGPPRRRALAAMLAMNANRTVTRDELVDGIWGERPPATVVNQVHGLVLALRRVLEPDRGPRAASAVLAATGTGYQLSIPAERIDVEEFHAYVRDGRTCVAGGDLTAAVDRLDAALALWRGKPLSDVPGPWAQAQRVRLDELRMTAVEERAEAALALGRYRQVVAALDAHLIERPLRERLALLLMTALYRDGRPAEALQVYDRIRRSLGEQLGVDPAADLQRLHREILRGEPDPPAAGAREPARVTVPAQLPLDVCGFAGRRAELARLDAIATRAGAEDTAVVVAAISGTAGVGKTTLAVHWAKLRSDRFPDGQLYVNLRGFDPTAPAMAPGDAIRRFLDALGVDARRVPADLDACAALFRTVTAERRLLVLLDNARDTEQVLPLLPGSPGCLVLVTSRDRLTDLIALHGARPVVVDVLDRDESHQLLARRLGAERVAAEPAVVDEVVTRCARLPLALAIAAARALAQPGFPLETLARDLHRLDGFAGGSTATDLRAVLSLSYRQLSPGAATLFRHLAQHPGPDVATPVAASLAGTPVDRVQRHLTELTRASLLTEHLPGRYTTHDLLRAYAAERCRTGETRQAHRRLLDHYLHTACAAAAWLSPHREPIPLDPPLHGAVPEVIASYEQAMTWLDSERTALVATAVTAADGGYDRQAWQLAWALTPYFARQGHCDDWIAVQHAALRAAVRAGEPARQADMHRGLARAYMRTGRHADAHAQFELALDLFTDAGDTTGRANTHMGIARLFSQRGGEYLDAALPHDRLALWLYRRSGHLLGQAQALNSLGWLHSLRGAHRQTLRNCRQALAILQRIDARTAEPPTLDSIGHALHKLGDHRQAITYLERALGLLQQTRDRYTTVAVLAHLGDARHALDDHAGAREAWQRALDILATVDTVDSSTALTLRTKLAGGVPGAVGATNLSL